jgi:hypothetical protein
MTLICTACMISGCLRSTPEEKVPTQIDYANIVIQTTTSTTATSTTHKHTTTTTDTTTSTLPSMEEYCYINRTNQTVCTIRDIATTTTATTTTEPPMKIKLQMIKNARPSLSNSAYSGGFFEMKELCMVAVGLNPPKFNEGPAPTNYKEFYDHLNGDENTTKTYDFLDLGGYFWLNRTPDGNGLYRWGWNDSQCMSSAMKVVKMEGRVNESN